VKIQIEVYCVETPCSDVVGYRRFGDPYRLYLQGEYVNRFILEEQTTETI